MVIPSELEPLIQDVLTRFENHMREAVIDELAGMPAEKHTDLRGLYKALTLARLRLTHGINEYRLKHPS